MLSSVHLLSRRQLTHVIIVQLKAKAEYEAAGHYADAGHCLKNADVASTCLALHRRVEEDCLLTHRTRAIVVLCAEAVEKLTEAEAMYEDLGKLSQAAKVLWALLMLCTLCFVCRLRAHVSYVGFAVGEGDGRNAGGCDGRKVSHGSLLEGCRHLQGRGACAYVCVCVIGSHAEARLTLH